MAPQVDVSDAREDPQEGLQVTPGQRRFGNLHIDEVGRRVHLDGREVLLTRLEFALLIALSDRPSIVCTPQNLLESVWGHSWFGDDHVVETHIGRLRTKLGETGRDPRFIHTVRGVGYRFDGQTARLHHVEYDASMVITRVEPADAPVLGWQPRDLVGQFVIFDSRVQGIEQHMSISIAQTMARSGSQAGPSVIGAFDAGGQQQSISLLMCFLPSPDGAFAGLVGHLLIDGGIAALSGSWPDEGHGSMCPLGP